MDTIFNNIFNSWQKCYNKHIFIDNENDKIIIIDNNNKNDNIHKTYYIEQSSNITCILNSKLNHLIINKCENISIIINSILISGMDVFHSNNILINNNCHNTSNFSLNFGQNYIFNINYLLNEFTFKLCINIIYNLNIHKLNLCYKYDKYITSLNLFTIQTLYFYITNYKKIKCIDTFYGTYDILKI